MRLCGSIRHDRGADFSASLFRRDNYGLLFHHFTQASVISSRMSFATEVPYIYFNIAFQNILALFEGLADKGEHPPCSFICNLQITFHGLCRNATLGIGKNHDCVEPESKGRIAFMKDCSRCWRELVTALGTLPLPASLLALERAAARALFCVQSFEDKL